MNRGADIRNWIDNGAEVHEGLRLLAKYAPNPIVERVVVANPALGHLLITALAKYAAPRQQEHQDESPLPPAQKSFREDFPFLAEHTCPIELKALAADKITAYYKYVDAHRRLTACGSNEEFYAVASEVIDNFLENRSIFEELDYYKEHGVVLGKHHIFSEARSLDALRKLSIKELFRKEENLKEAIWRIDSEIRKGDKPHLLSTRQRRKDVKLRELAEVQRMIEDYAI